MHAVNPPTDALEPGWLRRDRLARASLGWGIAGIAPFAVGIGAFGYAFSFGSRLSIDWQNWLLAVGLTIALLGVFPSIVAAFLGAISLALGTTNRKTAIAGLVLGGAVILAALAPVAALIVYGIITSMGGAQSPYQPQY